MASIKTLVLRCLGGQTMPLDSEMVGILCELPEMEVRTSLGKPHKQGIIRAEHAWVQGNGRIRPKLLYFTGSVK